MKKKVIFLLAIAICCVVISDFLTNYAHTNFWGAPVRTTGSPLDGQTCQQSGCHVSNVPVQNGGLVTSNIPASGYIPGNTYTITASITRTAQEFGFSLSPQNSSGIVGDLVVTNNQVSQRGPGYMTHSTQGNRSNTWSFDWVAPVSGTGGVTFYAAFLVSNFNFAATGDTTKTTSLAVTEDVSTKDITSFRFNALNPQVVGSINQNTQTISLTVPDGTNRTNLVPTIVHTGTSTNPPSGTPNDFTSPQDYTVTAENGTTKTYSVIVTEAGDVKNITSFKITNLNNEVNGVIDENTQSIALTVPYGTDVTNLVPAITHTGNSINPPSGVANDFSSPQTYTVTAVNATTKSYTVTVNVETDVLVTEHSLNHSFEIYPNPVSDRIFIKQALQSMFTSISIINKNGKVVKSYTTPKPIESFDVAELVSGIYFIKAETEKGSIIKKIIKL